VTRVKGARDLDDRDVTALREALEWRDRIARAKDRAPFRVVGDRTLLAAAQARPRTVDELADIKGMNGSLARSQGEDLLERLRRVEALGPEELRPYPRFEELGMSRGTLLPNQVLLEIARAAPDSRDGLRSVPGVRAWQVEALGKDLLERVPA
jgi:ribonuclease D